MDTIQRTKVYGAREVLSKELDSLRYLLNAAGDSKEPTRDIVVLAYNRAIQRLESVILALDVVIASWNEECK